MIVEGLVWGNVVEMKKNWTTTSIKDPDLTTSSLAPPSTLLTPTLPVPAFTFHHSSTLYHLQFCMPSIVAIEHHRSSLRHNLVDLGRGTRDVMS